MARGGSGGILVLWEPRGAEGSRPWLKAQNNLLIEGCARNGTSGKLQGKGNVFILPLHL